MVTGDGRDPCSSSDIQETEHRGPCASSPLGTAALALRQLQVPLPEGPSLLQSPFCLSATANLVVVGLALCRGAEEIWEV